jgi:hypothetical protein
MRFVPFLVLVGCASGRNEPAPATDAAGVDSAAPMIDAPTTPMPDAPVSATCTMAFTGQLAQWSFATEAGAQVMTPVTTKANGITAGAVTRSAGLTAVSGAASINSSGWPTAAARDLTRYYTATITPPAGCTMSITSVAIDALSSGTGPVSAVVSSSVDAYAATGTVATAAPTTVPMTIANANGMVEIRIYGYAAGAAAGTMRLRTNLTITGSLQ